MISNKSPVRPRRTQPLTLAKEFNVRAARHTETLVSEGRPGERLKSFRVVDITRGLVR